MFVVSAQILGYSRPRVYQRNYTGVARKRLYSLFKQKLYKIKSGIRRISRRDAEWLVAFMRDRCAQNVSKCKFYVSFPIIWVSTTVSFDHCPALAFHIRDEKFSRSLSCGSVSVSSLKRTRCRCAEFPGKIPFSKVLGRVTSSDSSRQTGFSFVSRSG